MSSRYYEQAHPASTTLYPSRQTTQPPEPRHEAAYDRTRRVYAESPREQTRDQRGVPSAPASNARYAPPAGVTSTNASPAVYPLPTPLSHLASPPTASQTQQYRVAGLDWAAPRTVHVLPEPSQTPLSQSRGGSVPVQPTETPNGLSGGPTQSNSRRQEGGDYAYTAERERARDEHVRRMRAEERNREQEQYNQELEQARERRRETRRSQRPAQDPRGLGDRGREGDSSDSAAFRGVVREGDSRSRVPGNTLRDHPPQRLQTTQPQTPIYDKLASSSYAAASSSRGQARPGSTQPARDRHLESQEQTIRATDRADARRQYNRDPYAYGSGSDTDRGASGRDRARVPGTIDGRGVTVSSRAHQVHDQNVPPPDAGRAYTSTAPSQRHRDVLTDPQSFPYQDSDRRLSKHAMNIDAREQRAWGYDTSPKLGDESSKYISRRPTEAEQPNRNYADAGGRNSDEYQREHKPRPRTLSSQAGQGASKPNVIAVDPSLRASQERLHSILQTPLSSSYPHNAGVNSGYISAPEAESRSARAQMMDAPTGQSNRNRAIGESRGMMAGATTSPYIPTPLAVPRNPSSNRSTYDASAQIAADTSPYKYPQRTPATPGNPASLPAIQRGDGPTTAPLARPPSAQPRTDPHSQAQEQRSAAFRGDSSGSRPEGQSRPNVRRVPVPSADAMMYAAKTPTAAFIAAPPPPQAYASVNTSARPSNPSGSVASAAPVWSQQSNGHNGGAIPHTSGPVPGQTSQLANYYPEDSPNRRGRPSLDKRASSRQLNAPRMPETQGREGLIPGREAPAPQSRESPGFQPRSVDPAGAATAPSTYNLAPRGLPSGVATAVTMSHQAGQQGGQQTEVERRVDASPAAAPRAQASLVAGGRTSRPFITSKPMKSSPSEGPPRTSMLEKAAAAVLSRVRSASTGQTTALSAMASSMAPATPASTRTGALANGRPTHAPSNSVPVALPQDIRDTTPKPPPVEDAQMSTPSTGRTGSAKSRAYHTPPTMPIGITASSTPPQAASAGQRAPNTKPSEATYQNRHANNGGVIAHSLSQTAAGIAAKVFGTTHPVTLPSASSYGPYQHPIHSAPATKTSFSVDGRQPPALPRDTLGATSSYQPPESGIANSQGFSTTPSALPTRPSFTNTQSFASSLNTPSSLTLQPDISTLPPPAANTVQMDIAAPAAAMQFHRPSDSPRSRRVEEAASGTPVRGPVMQPYGADSREPSIRAPSPVAPSISSQNFPPRAPSAPPMSSSQVSLDSRKKGSVFSRIFRPSKTSKDPSVGPPLTRITSDNSGTRRLIRKSSTAKGQAPAPPQASTRASSRAVPVGPPPSSPAPVRTPASRPGPTQSTHPEPPSPAQNRRTSVYQPSQTVLPVPGVPPQHPRGPEMPASGLANPSTRPERTNGTRGAIPSSRSDERVATSGMHDPTSSYTNGPPRQASATSTQRPPLVGHSSSSSAERRRRQAPPPSALRIPPTNTHLADKKSPIKSAFPIRFLVASHKRHRTVSSASLEALDGTRHTLQTTPSTSTLTASVAGPPSAFQQRDTSVATQVWRNEEAQAPTHGRGTRRPPGVTFDVAEDPPDDELENRARRTSMMRRGQIRPSR